MIVNGINVRRHGSGPSMVLIHGVGMCADYWQNIESTLAEHFELTLIDLPGHGNSELLSGYDKDSDQRPCLSEYSDFIARSLLDQGSPSIIVGHSMGALIALDLAVRYPENVAGIAVLNGVYRRSEQAQKAIDARVQELSKALDHPSSDKQLTNTTDTLTRWFGEIPVGINADASKLCKKWLEDANPLGYFQAYSAFSRADAPRDNELQSIKCPALFLTGSLEPNSTPSMSLSMTNLVDNARCVIIENAKHMMSMTHGDEVTTAIIDFFKSSKEDSQR